MSSDRQPIRLHLNATKGPGNVVEVDGVDLANHVRSITLTAGVDEVTTLTLEYICVKGGTVEGEAVVHHRCPLAEEDA